MDEDTLQGAMTILYLVKLLDDQGRLPALLAAIGCDLELDWNNQGLVEQCASECVFQDTRVYNHPGKYVSRHEYTADRWVYVLRDPKLSRYDALCREYEAHKKIHRVENPYFRELENEIHGAMLWNDYYYDYFLKDGTQDCKGPKIVLSLFDEFCSFIEITEALCRILDFCVSGIQRLECALAKSEDQVILLPAAHTPEDKEAA